MYSIHIIIKSVHVTSLPLLRPHCEDVANKGLIKYQLSELILLHTRCIFHICNVFRAVALGLTADDMAKVDSFIEDLKEQKEKDDAAEHIKKIAEADVLKVQVGKCTYL